MSKSLLHKIISSFSYSALLLINQKITSKTTAGFLDEQLQKCQWTSICHCRKHCQDLLLFAVLWCLFKSFCCADFGCFSEVIQSRPCESARLHGQTVPLGKLSRHQLLNNSKKKMKKNDSRVKIA